MRVEQLDHRAAKSKAAQLQATADALTDEMTIMRDEMTRMRAEQVDQLALMRDNTQLAEQLHNVESERDELRKQSFADFTPRVLMLLHVVRAAVVGLLLDRGGNAENLCRTRRGARDDFQAE